jgi:two-component system, sensor histidine kinase and response regulator
MRTRRLTSIGQKITRIILVTCGVSILLACTALAAYDAVTFRRELAGALVSAAGIVGSNSTAALLFSDAKAARETLGSLRAQPHIVEACIYTHDGAVFARYARPGADPNFTPPVRGSTGTSFTLRRVILFQPILLGHEEIGAIYLKSDLGALYARAQRFAIIVLLVILTSFLTAYFLASRLQHVISQPILELARTAAAVSLKKDYSLRAAKSSEDEVGSLADRFNEMLSQIQARDTDLQAAHHQLEARVVERTRELQNEVEERKQAERELEERKSFLDSVIENSPVGIVATSIEGIIRMCNSAFENLFHYRQQDILGRQLADLVASKDLRPEVESYQKAVAHGQTMHFITRRTRSDGALADVEVFAVPLITNGAPTGAVVLYQDITDRKRDEQALLRAKEAAEAANRAKSEFLANMSHEIRTPMNGIIGMTELALDTNLDSEQREYLEMVKSSANSLLTLINDILDFSKIEAGKLDLETIDFPIAESLGETFKALALRAHLKNLELAWRVEPAVPEYLKGDIGRLRQVLVNLVGNALKFTERGEVVVDVQKEAEDESGVLLHFRVRDTGIGIPTEKQAIIFDAFTQADSSASRKYGGTGLGLAITSRLVKLMGGKVWLESDPGIGSTFHFTAHFAPADNRRKVLKAAPPEILLGLRVLVVDDNHTNRTILVEMLTNWGMRPCPVDGGPSALEAMTRAHQQGEPFRLLITDMQMPGMDGCTLTEKIHQNPDFGQTPILILSSGVQQGDAKRCRELGVAGHLTKPVQPSELFDAILSALSKLPAISRPLPAHHDQPPDKTPGLKILLAEDNVVNRKLAMAILQKRGHTVVVAENGREALVALLRESVDLVLMDVQMPVMDGFEAIHAIRTREQSTGAHLPIIALTAHALKGDRERCLAAGADDYVSKPIQLAELIAAMNRVKTGSARNGPLAPLAPPAPAAPSSPRLDTAAALERVEGDRELLEEIVHLFADECPANLKVIRQAAAAGDLHLLERLAHTVKGASLSVGGVSVAKAALVLETQARAGDLANVAQLIENLANEIELLLPELESFCRKVTH